jgi:hypothetical protein
MFRRATEIDPKYALAYAQLAYAYASIALFTEADPIWVERTKEALRMASQLDPSLAETHVVRHLILYSAYEGFQIEPAFRELQLARELNPSVGHFERGSMLLHLAVESAIRELQRELQRALAIDPTDSGIQGELANAYAYLCMPEEAVATHRKFFGRPAPVEAFF